MEQTKSEWYIISAKYGLLRPDEMLYPYDLNLGDLPADRREKWADSIVDKLAPTHTEFTRYVILADDLYSESLAKSFLTHNYKYTVPFWGMSHDKVIEHLKNNQIFATMSSDEFKKGQKITLLIIEEGIFTISLGVL